MASLGLALLASLVYARMLGPHDYGLYAYVTAWGAVLAIPTGLGFQQYLVRQGALASDAHARIRRWADKRVLLAGAGAAVLMAATATIPAAAGARMLFLIAAPLPLIANLTTIRQSLLQARGEFVASQWPPMLLAPAILLCALAGLWMTTGTVSAPQLTALTVATALVSLVVVSTKLRSLVDEGRPGVQIRLSLRTALSFMWLGMLYLLNSRVDLFMLGTLRGAESAGIYSVAAKAAELVGVFLITANSVLAPKFARLYRNRDLDSLQRLVSKASMWIAALTLPVALTMVLAARPLITHLYGADFAQGADALRVLAIGQAFNVAAGPTGMLLNMTGHERLSAMGVGLSMLLNIVLNAALVPRYDALGAAVATTISVMTWNVLLLYWVRKRLGLKASVLGI